MNRVLRALLLMLPAVNAAADPAGLREALARLGVSGEPGQLRAAPLPGFLEVSQGAKVLYVSRDGELLIDGDVVSLKSGANLTQRRQGMLRLGLLERIPARERIVVAASGPARTRLVVFADTDCPYCLQLHRRQDELLRRGVEIQYLFYPRSGPGSESFGQAVAVWCAPDRDAALDAVLAGTRLPPARCVNPVMKHYEMAMELKLKGTPAIITADGAVQYGTSDIEKLLVATPAR